MKEKAKSEIRRIFQAPHSIGIQKFQEIENLIFDAINQKVEDAKYELIISPGFTNAQTMIIGWLNQLHLAQESFVNGINSLKPDENLKSSLNQIMEDATNSAQDILSKINSIQIIL